MMENQHLIPVSRRNWELGRQLQGILRKTNKKRANKYIHRHTSMHVGMYDCMRVRARACVCWHYFAHLSTVSVCLPVHTVNTWTHTHTQATLKTKGKTGQVMIENQHFHSSTVFQYSATRNTHTHWSDESPAKMSGGSADNWLLDKPSDLYRGET